jgi:hypothetical protein
VGGWRLAKLQGTCPELLQKRHKKLFEVNRLKVLSRAIIKSQKIEKPIILRLLYIGFLGIITLATINCGGSSGGSSSIKNNPAPSITSILPISAPAGSSAITLTVVGSSFISGSVIKWNGSNRDTVYVSSIQLRTTISPTDLASSGTVSVTVYNPTPGGGTSTALTFIITAVSPVSITTTALPNASHKKSYNYSLHTSGGISPYTWSIINGTLPSGISLSDDGVLSGTPASIASDTSSVFTVQVRDSSYSPRTSIQPLSILVLSGDLGRNDSCPSTTSVISNGTIRASISPHGDVDVFSFQGTAGNSITAEITAQRLQLYTGSTTQDVFLDSFLELLDSNCNQITYNDDITLGTIWDSKITYTLPSTGTYYLRVSDLRGDGRPDFIYELNLSGAN